MLIFSKILSKHEWYTIYVKKQYEVLNIKCGGCASTVTDALVERFPDIEVQLDVEPRIVSATIASEADEVYLLDTLRKLGYPLSSDDMSVVTKKYLYGKSYVSCMHGKLKSSK
jgi:copper chaperone